MEQITELEEEVKDFSSSSQTVFVRNFQCINQNISLNNFSSGGRSEEPAGAANKRADESGGKQEGRAREARSA